MQRTYYSSGLESGFSVVPVTVHTKVTSIAHTAAGMGQVWYRVTGATGVGNRQVAYRVGVGAEDVRRVRFVGAGATADLVGFRPGGLVGGEADLVLIERAFSGECLTRGVKTQRSRFARVPGEPVHVAVTEALAAAGLDPRVVFTSRDAGTWWRAVVRAAGSGRSVSFLTADGVLRAVGRAGGVVDGDVLRGGLGQVARERVTGVVAVGRVGLDAVTQLDLAVLEVELLSDVELGERVWTGAREAASRHEPVGNAGYELTLTLPKSFSLYAITGDADQRGDWLDAMEGAATRALERLMAEAGFCSTGHRGDGENVTIVPADGWAGFIATEISSRAGDPHLHVHCTLPNILVGRDGVVRTMADGGRELIINAPRFAAWGQAFVVEEAAARGLIPGAWFHPGTAQWEVGGFTDETIVAFSRGRRAVLAEEDGSDDASPRTAKARSLRQRQAKGRVTAAKSDEQPTWAQVQAAVGARAAELGVDLTAERHGDGSGRFLQPDEWTDANWVSWVEGVACQHESVTSLAKIRSIVDLATAALPDAERLRIARLVVDDGFVRGHESRDRGMRTGGQQWVSRTALDAESRLLDRMTASAGRLPQLTWRTRSGVTRFEAERGWQLSGEQCAAVEAIVDGSAPITLISGVGGSGKTSVLAAARMGLAGERYSMLVTSTATRAASTAGHESGAPWMNLTALMHRIQSGTRVQASIIVVDEASMADVSTIARLADWCADTNRRLVLQGDHAQLRAVGAGDAFNVLCREFPDEVVRLETNQRQRTDIGRIIAAALHARYVDTAWDAITADNAVLVARNREHKLTLVADVVAREIAVHGAGQVTCDAVTNIEVDELNQRIHDQLLARGTLDPDKAITYRTPAGDRALAPGSVLRVTVPANHRDPSQRLVRGEHATVVDPGRDRVRIQFDDGRERSMTPRALLRHLDYAYAGTTHKLQGQTSSVHVAALQPAKDAASMYVSASRGRDRTIFVADARDYLTDRELRAATTWEPRDLDDEVLERVHQALTRQPERIDSPREHLRPQWTHSGPGAPSSGIAMGS